MLSKQIEDRLTFSSRTSADSSKTICTNSLGTLDSSFIRVINLLRIETTSPILTPSGRLTLSSTDPTADGSGLSTLHYLPFRGDLVPFWNMSSNRWIYRPIPDEGVSTDVSASGVGSNFDVYAQPTADGLTLTLQGWSNNTTRNFRALIQKDGLYMLDYTNDDLRTYLGSIRTTGTAGAATLQDSNTQRYVFNAYNQVRKRLVKLETTAGNWTYSGSTWRAWNNSTANRIEVLDGLGGGNIDLSFTARLSPGAGFGQIGIGMDTTTNATEGVALSATGDTTISNRTCRPMSLGYHYFQALEAANGSVASTFYGQSLYGLQGHWWC